MLISALCSVQAEDTPNARQARRIFNEAYNQFFGEEGAKLHYDVNIIGIYKTSGTIWRKGNKSKFADAKVMSWNDGQTIYTFRRKKKTVEIYDATDNKRDKYSRKFNFNLDNFDYSIAEEDEGLMITLKTKKGVKGMKGIKEAHVLVERKTYHPIRLRLKVAFIWTTIKISEFQAGGITDEMLRFPMEEYKNYKFDDKR